jgi:protein MAK11
MDFGSTGSRSGGREAQAQRRSRHSNKKRRFVKRRRRIEDEDEDEEGKATTMGGGTILAGSYERFVFGYTLRENSGEDGNSERRDTRLMKSFTADAHGASVKAIACNGGYAASGGSDDLIRVYHCDGEGAMADLGVLVGHQGDARCLEFYAPSGYAPTRLMSGSSDGSVMVWDATGNFELLKTMRAHRGGVNSISAHQSGRVALTCGADSHVAMWDMRKGRVAYKFKTPERVEKLAFASGGNEYITQGMQRVSVTNAEAGNVITSFTTPQKTLSFETSGKMVYVGCEGGDVLCYDVRADASQGAVARLAKAHPQRVRGLALVSDKNDETVGDSGAALLVTAGSEGCVRAWDLRNASSKVHDDTPATPLAELETGARYTCLCAMSSNQPPEAPQQKFKLQPKAQQSEAPPKKDKTPSQKPSKPIKNKKQRATQARANDDNDFEIVPESAPSAKQNRFNDDDSDDDEPYAKPAEGRNKRRGGAAYEKMATAARRKAHGIKPKKKRM